jgi:hypothetical protein
MQHVSVSSVACRNHDLDLVCEFTAEADGVIAARF